MAKPSNDTETFLSMSDVSSVQDVGYGSYRFDIGPFYNVKSVEITDVSFPQQNNVYTNYVCIKGMPVIDTNDAFPDVTALLRWPSTAVTTTTPYRFSPVLPQLSRLIVSIMSAPGGGLPVTSITFPTLFHMTLRIVCDGDSKMAKYT